MSELNDSKPKPPPRRKLSAFALATDCVSVSATIDIDDVLHARPTWTPQQAAEFLRQHADVIGPAMAMRGAELLVLMLPGEDHVQ